MNRSSRRVFGVIAMAIGCLVGACSAPGPVTPGAPESSSPPSFGASSPSAAETPTPTIASDTPIAVLVVGADRHAGEVGGFTFGTITQSAPWLPATALDRVEVAAGSALRVELDDRATIAGWMARVATADDVSAETITGLAEDDGPPAAFAAPSAGDWVLSVTITYGEGLGSGAYFWHVVVR